MFASLFKKAQATVDNAVSQVVNRLIVVVPFVVAVGFATAAAFHWLSDSYGVQTASLVLAAIYAAFGAILGFSIYPASSDTTDSALDDAQAEANPAGPADDQSSRAMADLDQELLIKTLASAAPIAVPLILRNVVKHLPILLAVASAAFVLSRSADATEEPGSTDLQAAE